MKSDCPFLEHQRHPQAGSTVRCGVGINFYAVGQDLGLCQACSIGFQGWLPDCGHLDAYAWLEGYPGEAPFVSVELFCGLTGDPLPGLLSCARCPERLPQSASLSRPVLAPVLTGLRLAGSIS